MANKVDILNETLIEEIKISPYYSAIIALSQQKLKQIVEKREQLEKLEKYIKSSENILTPYLYQKNPNPSIEYLRRIIVQNIEKYGDKLDTLTLKQLEEKLLEAEKNYCDDFNGRINCLGWLINMPRGVDSHTFTGRNGKEQTFEKSKMYSDFIEVIKNSTIKLVSLHQNILRIILHSLRKKKNASEEELKEMNEMNYQVFLDEENIKNMKQMDSNLLEFFNYQDLTVKHFIKLDCVTVFNNLSNIKTKEEEEKAESQRKVG